MNAQHDALAFLDSTLVVYGDEPEVRAAIDRKSAQPSLSAAVLAEVDRLSTSQDAWVTLAMPLSTILGPVPAGAGGPPRSCASSAASRRRREIRRE